MRRPPCPGSPTWTGQNLRCAPAQHGENIVVRYIGDLDVQGERRRGFRPQIDVARRSEEPRLYCGSKFQTHRRAFERLADDMQFVQRPGVICVVLRIENRQRHRHRIKMHRKGVALRCLTVVEGTYIRCLLVCGHQSYTSPTVKRVGKPFAARWGFQDRLPDNVKIDVVRDRNGMTMQRDYPLGQEQDD